MGLAIFGQQLISTFVLIIILGLCASVVAIPMQTTIQAETPEEMRGKVFGLQNNAVNIALSLPLALAGVAETYLGLSAVFVGLGAMATVGGILTWYISIQES
jgi:predicted MFS family arabinose efflux permease